MNVLRSTTRLEWWLLPWLLLLSSCALPTQEGSTGMSSSETPSPFEEMLSGFERCDFRDVYLDLETGKPVHPYLLERGLEPCEISDELAYFCIDEEFHGLPVSRLMVPASTFDLHGLFIDLPLAQARSISKARLGSEFREDQDSADGKAPELLPDPQDPNRSVLMCNQKAV